jgi:hypothetical protein
MTVESRKVITNCKTCGKEFVTTKGILAQGRGKNCSVECQVNARRCDRIVVHCQKCNKEFKVRQYQLERGQGKYCSRICRTKNEQGSLEKVTVNCLVCNNEFETDKYTISKGLGKYCSLKCVGISQRSKGYDPEARTSERYENWTKEVYKQGNHICYLCGIKDKMNAHHIFPWKDYPELRFVIENGLCLCERCHIDLHVKPLPFKNNAIVFPHYLGYIIDRIQEGIECQ